MWKAEMDFFRACGGQWEVVRGCSGVGKGLLSRWMLVGDKGG